MKISPVLIVGITALPLLPRVIREIAMKSPAKTALYAGVAFVAGKLEALASVAHDRCPDPSFRRRRWGELSMVFGAVTSAAVGAALAHMPDKAFDEIFNGPRDKSDGGGFVGTPDGDVSSGHLFPMPGIPTGPRTGTDPHFNASYADFCQRIEDDFARGVLGSRAEADALAWAWQQGWSAHASAPAGDEDPK